MLEPSLSFDEYQKYAAETAVYPINVELTYLTIGLTNEAGEFAGKIKKILRGDYTQEQCHSDLVLELGDVLWYAAQIATALGIKLSNVAGANISKLHDRKARNTIQGDGDKR